MLQIRNQGNEGPSYSRLEIGPGDTEEGERALCFDTKPSILCKNTDVIIGEEAVRELIDRLQAWADEETFVAASAIQGHLDV